MGLPRSLARLETACCLALAVLLLSKGFLPGWRSLNSDFPNYYLVARLAREGYSLDRIYDWIWLTRIKDHWGLAQPLVGFAGLTPFSALPLEPFSWLEPLTAKRVWLVIHVLLIGASVELLNRTTTLGRKRIWLLCLLCVFPLRTNFLLGQMHLVVLALLVAAFALYQEERYVLCGACLSLAGLLKIYPLLFAAYFAWKRQWTALAAICGATVVFTGLSTLLLGHGILHTYFFDILPGSLVGEVLDPYSTRSASMAALMHKLFLYEPQLNPSPWLNSPRLYSLLYPLWQIAVFAPLFALLGRDRGDRARTQLEWAAWVFTLLLLSPVPSSYHFVVMALCMVLLADHLSNDKRLTTLAVGLYCLISLVGFLPPALGISRLFVAIAYWLLLLFCLARDSRKTRARNLLWPQTALLCGMACLLWAASVLSYQRHFAWLDENMHHRLFPIPSAYLATEPKVTSNGLVFVAMQNDGYRAMDQNGKLIDPCDADILSIAANSHSPDVVMEVADSSGSWLTSGPGKGPEKNQCPTPALFSGLGGYAESPSLSQDGGKLVFIREVKGHGSLWSASAQASPVQLTNATYDVHNFSLAPSGWIVFSAKVEGKMFLFQRMPDGATTELAPGLTDVDEPAISPDEQRIAFTRKIAHRRQLELLDRSTGHRSTLTRGDCNHDQPEWLSAHRIAYATDCSRGQGLTALAAIEIPTSGIKNAPAS